MARPDLGQGPRPENGVVARPADGTVARDEPEVESPERRRLLIRLSVIPSAIIGVLLGVPVLGYLLAPLLNPTRPIWLDLGAVDEYQIGATVMKSITDPSPLPYAGLVSATAAYVRRDRPDNFIVFAVNCTHLGCPVNWLDTAGLFLCPCHGGVYYADGTVAAGPPQHPLYQYATRIDSGRLFVQTMPLPPARPWDPSQLPRRRTQQQQQG